MPRSRLILLRRVLLILAGLALLWAIVVSSVGGFILRLGPLRVSSRNPRNILLLTIACAIGVRILSSPRFAGPFSQEWTWWHRLAKATIAWLYPAVRVAGRLRLMLASGATVAVIGASLDVYQWAGPPPLWQDEEAIALNFRDRTFGELTGALWLGQSAPLAWLAVQRAIVLSLGTSELAIRLVPLFFGIATVAAAAWIGRRWLTRSGGLVLVVLCWAGTFLAYYRFEVKHYTADAFWALLLPALAIWVVEGINARQRGRRAAIWWAAAAVGQFFANGALLATPGCALYLFVLVWQRDGRRGAASFASWGLVWLASFSVHYLCCIRYAHHSVYLRSFWASALPPEHAGPATRVTWLIARFRPLALDPGGTQLWPSLWLLAMAGFVGAFRRPLGGIFATVPLSAFGLAALGLVPLRERLALWVVPSLYMGVALAFDSAARHLRDSVETRRWLRVAGSLVVIVLVLRVGSDIWQRGWARREIERVRHSKQRMNDAIGVRWLMHHHRPGDALMATRLTWPALWWYGEISIGGTAGRRSVDPGAMYEVAHVRPGPGCGRDPLNETLKKHRRVLAYLSFPDQPDGFEDLLLRHLEALGVVVAAGEFSKLSRAVVIDLEAPQSGALLSIPPGRLSPEGRPPLDGCVAIRPARRW